MYEKRMIGVRLAACLALLVVLSACGRGLKAVPASSGLSDLLRPTWTPVYHDQAAISIDPQHAPEPTLTEQPVPTQMPFELGAAVYRHPEGLFQVPLPAGWRVAEELADQVLLEDPRWQRSIRVGVTQTGAVLDGPAFERFVEARETNLFAGNDTYEVLAQQIDADEGTATLEKMQADQSQRLWAFSYYRQSGETILWLDFQQADYLKPYLAPPPAALMRQAMVDSRRAASLQPYQEMIDLSDPGGTFELQIPAAWSQREVIRDQVIAHLIESPDRNARVQLIVFAEEGGLSGQDAGNLALELLRSLYPGSINVTADIVRSDGVEYLVWTWVENGSQGYSFFAIRGTTFFLLTTLVSDQVIDHYRTSIAAVQHSFRLP